MPNLITQTFLVDLHESFRINVSRYGEHLWKFPLQKNKDEKSYQVAN